ncbi:DUF2913 family protein [Vibrio maritimus]|uniref:DUF2913 family protein n=1 Tax=Vibrio maritimus TaxID=990268 RepID=UPI001F18D07F|nr:DUF2913 family protein [Vibrio maritimus]
MQPIKDFDYYRNLHQVVSNALLHLLCKISVSERHIPTAKRNEILIRYLKPKASDKAYSNIKKDIKLMLQVGRHKRGNLERRLYQLNDKAKETKIIGAERLYSLLVYLYDHEGIESKLFEEGQTPEPGILYMLESHIENCIDEDDNQVSPMSMLIQLERAPELIDIINQHGCFQAEMKEWNSDTFQAHLLLHPAMKH